jgi:hypothetical protein
MSENGASTSKAPATGRGADRSLVDVQPFRMSDLQPKYAHQIDHAREDNPDAHGWYAGLSELCQSPYLLQLLS